MSLHIKLPVDMLSLKEQHSWQPRGKKNGPVDSSESEGMIKPQDGPFFTSPVCRRLHFCASSGRLTDGSCQEVLQRVTDSLRR